MQSSHDIASITFHISKSTLYPNLVIFISQTSVEFVIFFLFLQPLLLQIHLFPANLTIAIHFILASHKQISTNFNAFKIHWHVSLQILQNINTSHQHSKNYTGFLSNKESTTKPVFSHTKHLQINNLHIFTIVFHSLHILFLHDLLIRLLFPFHMSDHHLAKGLSLSLVHASGIHSPLIPETHLLYQYSVPDSKHTSSKLRSLPIGSFPSPWTVYPDFDSCYSHFMPYRMTRSVRHRAIEVHYYYYYYYMTLHIPHEISRIGFNVIPHAHDVQRVTYCTRVVYGSDGPAGWFGSRFCRNMVGLVGSALWIFQSFTDYFLVPKSI